MSKHGKTSGVALRIFCAMLLVLLGFAHRPVASAPLGELATYVLPDGSVASLCTPSEDGRQGKHVDPRCEVCRISSDIAAPMAPAVSQDIQLHAAVVTFAFVPERFHRLAFPPNAPPRGPPVLPVSSATV